MNIDSNFRSRIEFRRRRRLDFVEFLVRELRAVRESFCPIEELVVEYHGEADWLSEKMGALAADGELADLFGPEASWGDHVRKIKIANSNGNWGLEYTGGKKDNSDVAPKDGEAVVDM